MTFELTGVGTTEKRIITSKLLPITLQYDKPYTPRWEAIDRDRWNIVVPDQDTLATRTLTDLLDVLNVTYRVI